MLPSYQKKFQGRSLSISWKSADRNYDNNSPESSNYYKNKFMVNINSKNHQFWSYWRPRPLKSCVLTCQTRSINNPVQFLLGTLWKIKKRGQNCFDLSNLRSYIGFQGTQSCVFCLVIHLQVFSMTKFHSSSVAFIPKKISRPQLKY